MNNIIRKPFRYCNYNTVFWLIGINVIVFALMFFFGNIVISVLEVDITKLGLPPRGGRTLAFEISLGGALAMIPITVLHGYLWTFVTYMFMHGGAMHLLFNMLGLYIFGMHVERQMGSKEFILYYMITGIFAGILSFVIYYFTGQLRVSLVGASGALYAVMLAYAVFYPDSIIYIWGIIPLRAPIMVIGFTAIAIISQVTGRGGNVAHITHLGGFIFGWLYFMIRFGINPWHRLFRR